jgi:hypothetical protein
VGDIYKMSVMTKAAAGHTVGIVSQTQLNLLIVQIKTWSCQRGDRNDLGPPSLRAPGEDYCLALGALRVQRKL